MIKEVWIPKSGTMPLIRNVLIEKTVIDLEFKQLLFVNGIPIYLVRRVDENNEYFVKPHRIKMQKDHLKYCHVVTALMINMPTETILKDSKILWRLSKFSFNSRAYKDSVNNRIVINKL